MKGEYKIGYKLKSHIPCETVSFNEIKVHQNMKIRNYYSKIIMHRKINCVDVYGTLISFWFEGSNFISLIIGSKLQECKIIFQNEL